jgi:hypothetical protein
MGHEITSDLNEIAARVARLPSASLAIEETVLGRRFH